MSNQLFSRNLKLKWLTGQSNMSEPSHRHKEAHSYHHVVLTQPVSGYESHVHSHKRSHALQYTVLGMGSLAVVSLVWWLNNSDAFYQDNQQLSLQENIANKLSQIPQSLGQSAPPNASETSNEAVATTTPSEQPSVATASTPSWSPWLYLNVQPGDTLLVIFERNRLNLDDMYQLLEVAEYSDNLHSLYPNQEMRVKRDANNGVEELFAALDLNTELHIFKNDAGFGGEIMQFNEQSGRMQVVTDPKILAEFGGEAVIVPKTQLSEVTPKTPVAAAKTPVKLTEAEVAKVNKDEKAAKAAQAKEAAAHKLAIQEAIKEKRLKAVAETNAKKTARETAIKEAIAKKEAAQKAAKIAAAEEATAKKSVTHSNVNAEESAAKKAARIAAVEEAAARKAARLAAAEEVAAKRAEQQAAAEERVAARRAEQQAIAEERATRRAEQQSVAEERAAAKRAEQQAAAEERATQLAKQVAIRQAQERQAAQEAAAARQVAAMAPQRAVRQEVNHVVSSVRQSFTQTPRQISSLPIPSPVEPARPVAKRRTAASDVGTTVFDDVDSRYTSSSDPRLSKVLDSARDLVGTPYRFGGTTPKGFDCSGFVRYNARLAGAELPRTAREQYSATKAVDKEELRPGDLVFFNTRGRGIGHVGIYVGDNKFIHAPNKRKDVQVSSMNDKYYKQRYVRGGRF